MEQVLVRREGQLERGEKRAGRGWKQASGCLACRQALVGLGRHGMGRNVCMESGEAGVGNLMMRMEGSGGLFL